jgi:hypothetical protein
MQKKKLFNFYASFTGRPKTIIFMECISTYLNINVEIEPFCKEISIFFLSNTRQMPKNVLAMYPKRSAAELSL